MTHQPHITAELVNTIARAPFDTGRAGVPWDALAPITQHALRESALAFLADTLPILIARGWTPPRSVITNYDDMKTLADGTVIRDRTGDVGERADGTWRVYWEIDSHGQPERLPDAYFSLPITILQEPER